LCTADLCDAARAVAALTYCLKEGISECGCACCVGVV
jgi:hypothetical protein